MKTNNSSRKKRFLALLLSMLMGSSVAVLAACNGDSSSDSSSSSSSSSASEEIEESEEEKSYPIQNPDFSTINDDNNLKYFATSVPSWTRAANNPSTGTAQSSKAASGVIDTSDAAWTSLTENNKENIDAATLTEEQAKNNWSKLTLKDKLAYYEAWEDNNDDDDKKLSDLSFYQSVTIDEDDLPVDIKDKNPRTWDYTAEKAAEKNYDSHVLMIHNEYTTTTYKKQGTAQKYTSSSTVTVAAGTAMELSLWVKTTDLRSATTGNAENGQFPVDKGAYIRITHSVGSQQLEPLEVKNINTEAMGITDNNGWAKYSFYLHGSSFSDTTFTLVLGLGQGGGDDSLDYVNGYAFFDDIECKPINETDYNTATANLEKFTLEHTTAEEKTVAAKKGESTFALDFSGSTFVNSTYLTDKDAQNNSYFSYEYTTENNKTDGAFTAVGTAASGIAKPAKAKKPTSLGSAINGANDVATVFANPADMANGNRFLQAAYNNYLLGDDKAESKFFANAKLTDKSVLMLLSAEGAALTAKNAQTITEAQGEYLAFSFFVKTSKMSGTAGATVTLKDENGNTLASISSIDTTTATTITVGDDKDYYDGWQQCFFFISAEKAATLTLQFQLGPTTVIGTTQDAYKSGFAAFAGFKTYNFKDGDQNVLDEEFKLAAENTYAKVVTVADEDSENSDSFDSVAAVSPAGKNIEENYATPKNYKLYEGSDKPTGTNALATAGLLNQKYADAYNEKGILEQLGATGDTATARWESVFGGGLLGTANQPLVIYNDQYATKSYGFVGSTQTVAANNYAAISMRVKVSAGAKAYIYLIDTNDDSFNSTLSIAGKRTYWYDDDGNVCVEDPAENSQDKNIALKLQSNGLYLVNEAWWKTVSSEPVPKGYYANLQAYGTPVNDNLMVAEGGVSYDYFDKWQHDGNDGIAFYGYKDENNKKTAYSDSGKKTLVEDFSNLTQLPARYDAEEARNLQFVVDGTATNGEWANVTFFIKNGENAKTYRLEIWSGSRDGKTEEDAPASGYVIVDSRNVGTLDETGYTNNITLREDVADDKFEGVFSFYDSAKYLRYNADIDDNEVGNSYDNYIQSDKVSGIAYLTYQEGNTFETYVNYSLSEYEVTADEAETEEEEDDSSSDDGEVNVWLLASSIAIAAVLVLAVISLIVRKAFTSARKKRGYTTSNKNDKK